MTITVDVLAVEVLQDFRYDQISDQNTRDFAMAAAGTIRGNLGDAVSKVLEAGRLLQMAKDRLPHGSYLPWVKKECGLTATYASKLIKAAEWANVAPGQHLDGMASVTTLFLLSADTTPEDVRTWFMERCEAGDVPTRKEVQERKRRAASPREPRPSEALALALLRKGEIQQMREALALAERAQIIGSEQVMAEQRLRELPKSKVIYGIEADFHKQPDGQWIRLPHSGEVEIRAEAVDDSICNQLWEPTPELQEQHASPQKESELLTLASAALKLDVRRRYLSQQLTPSSSKIRNGKPFIYKGYKITRDVRGMVRLSPVTA